MTALSTTMPGGLRRFRLKLTVTMMLIVSAITGAGLYFAQRNLAATVEKDKRREFQGLLDALHGVHELRHAALAGICRTLVRKPRIHAALEDNALDLLYPTARDELRDVVNPKGRQSPRQALQGVFYRFLDQKGAVISPPAGLDMGKLRADEETQLALPRLPREPQLGYLVRKTTGGRDEVTEVITMTIISSDTDDAIAALSIGFKPIEPVGMRAEKRIRSGIWLNGRLYFPSLAETSQAALGNELNRALAAPDGAGKSIPVQVGGAPHLLFYKQLNPGSHYPRAYEASIFPLTDLVARQRQLRWRVVGAGALLLFGGLVASQFFSRRLSRPVERLAVDSEENRRQRARAEAALEVTNEGLQRAIRFSADASHQLKTPVSVLRAGLEEQLAREDLTPEVRQELAELVHQTFRLTTVIEDLLLLSRADAGRLQLNFAPVDLTQLLEAGLDDLSARPGATNLTVETDFPPTLQIAGEKRYTTIIVQNLLENAQKYNRPAGRIRVTARTNGESVFLTIGNTGPPIPAAMQGHIFERFHRGSVGENVPGHGLGLNLARELARLHGGDLRLVRSDVAWTEFEVRFRVTMPAPGNIPARK